MALSGQDKTIATLVKQTKTSATLLGFKKSGNGWDYDQADITYDMDIDSQGRPVLYDSLGTATALTGLNKTSA